MNNKLLKCHICKGKGIFSNEKRQGICLYCQGSGHRRRE